MSLNLSAAWNLNIGCQAKNAGDVGTFGPSKNRKARLAVCHIWRPGHLDKIPVLTYSHSLVSNLRSAMLRTCAGE